MYKQYDLSNAKFDKKGLSNDEKRSVGSLIKFLGWEIDIVHRVNIPDGVKTPDIYAEGEYWDIKNYKKSLTSKSEFQKVWHSIDKGLNQANNFVVDLNSNKIYLYDTSIEDGFSDFVLNIESIDYNSDFNLLNIRLTKLIL